LERRSDSSIRNANPPADIPQFGYSTLGNAGNNGTALREIAKTSGAWVSFATLMNTIGCVGHDINLAVKALLYGAHNEDDILLAAKDSDANSSTMNSKSQSRREEKDQQQQWRKQGPVGQLRNDITAMKLTPQRRDEFRSCVSALNLPLTVEHELVSPNDPRWNSDYQAIRRALFLRDAVDSLIIGHLVDENTMPGLEHHIIEPDDWSYLPGIAEILSPFELCTKELEGKWQYGELYDGFCVHDKLLAHLEERKVCIVILNSELG